LFVKFEGQAADGALIPAEQFAVGGMNTVRGYDERLLLGDHGGVATIELRAPILQDLSTRPFKKSEGKNESDRMVDRLQGLLFVDAGFITRAETLQGETRNESISSAGLGLRWALSRYAQVRADVGYRIDELYDQDRGVGFHVSAQIQY
jgi:hemolysin activation/secretion protein